MRRYILLFALCALFFIFPFQVFIIGDNVGIGVQTPVFRYQVTEYGNSLMPVVKEISYVFTGIYSGRTALSVILWMLGTILLACTLIYSFIHIDDVNADFFRQAMYGLVASCCIYFASCLAQYGFYFHSLAGISLPVGIVMILIWTPLIYKYHGIFDESELPDPSQSN